MILHCKIFLIALLDLNGRGSSKLVTRAALGGDVEMVDGGWWMAWWIGRRRPWLSGCGGCTVYCVHSGQRGRGIFGVWSPEYRVSFIIFELSIENCEDYIERLHRRVHREVNQLSRPFAKAASKINESWSGSQRSCLPLFRSINIPQYPSQHSASITRATSWRSRRRPWKRPRFP